MRNLLRFAAWPVTCGLLIALLILQYLDQPPDNRQQPRSFADAVARTAPAVVNIYSSKVVQQKIHPFFNDPFFKHYFERSNSPRQQRILSSLGSGVIVSEDGYLLTNHHVIKDADEILVSLNDGRESLATVVGYDKETDLAVLHIALDDLTAAPMGDPMDARVGDVVLAIGNPFGYEQTVTQGIISAIGRHGVQISTYENFIQTDAAINPGNSGGALIDSQGYLLGINTAIISQSGGYQGVGLAIPADIASKVLLDLIKYGRVIRGWLGVEARLLNPAFASRVGLEPEQHGMVITGTHPMGPAAKAGLLPGDIIIRIDGQSIRNGQLSMQQVANAEPGDTLKLSVYRDGRQLDLEATVGVRPTNN